MYLNCNLTWDTHVSKIVSRANKCIFVLIRAKKIKLSIRTLVTLYTWYIRTALEYAAPVWHAGLTELQHTRIERVQRRCLRLILGREYHGYEEALQQLQLTTLRSRRDLLTLRLARSILRSADHRDLLPPRMEEVHRYPIRGNQRLRTVDCRRTERQKSFVPYAVKLLNDNMQ